MVPANLYDLLAIRGKKLPIYWHSAMVPWTANFVADISNGSSGSEDSDGPWSADEVM